MRHSYLLSALLPTAVTAHAGVIIDGTRLVYQGEKKSSIGISNWMILTIWYNSGGYRLEKKAVKHRF